MKRFIAIILSLSVFTAMICFSGFKSGFSDNSSSIQLAADSLNKIELLFVGDIMQHGPQIRAAYEDKTRTYSYDECFQYVKPLISSADFAIGNFETTLAGAPYSGYPAFCAPDNLLYTLKSSGFDMMLTANNHCLDKGKKGLERTIDMLDNISLPHTGTFLDTTFRNQNYPLLILHSGFKIAYLNYTYATNGIEVSAPNIVNYIDKKQICRDIKSAKAEKPDYIIAVFHWGIEYQREENAEQEDIAKMCFENGVDLIIGSHPHVVQPIKKVKYRYNGEDKEGLVVYSMGNYLSNQRARYKDGGIMANIKLVKNKYTGKVRMDDYAYTPVWVYKQELPADTNFFLLPGKMCDDGELPVDMNNKDREDFSTFLKDTREVLKGVREKQ